MIRGLRSRRAAGRARLRSPEQLALAMPIVAVAGAMVVVGVAAIGGSARAVAIAAVGAFGLSAFLPLALMDLFVGRPLRAALASLQAARDGQSPADAPAAAGLAGELIAVARELGATQGMRPPVRPPRAELAEAWPSPPLAEMLDGANERIESMLVYIAEALDRREARYELAEARLVAVERFHALQREAETTRAAALRATKDLTAAAHSLDAMARPRFSERADVRSAPRAPNDRVGSDAETRDRVLVEASRAALGPRSLDSGQGSRAVSPP